MASTAELTEEKVLEVLRTVSSRASRATSFRSGSSRTSLSGAATSSFRLEIMTESPRAAEEIQRDATEKLRSLPGVNAVTIRLDRPGAAPGLRRAAPPACRRRRRDPAGRPLQDRRRLRQGRRRKVHRDGEPGAGPRAPRATASGLMDSDIYGPSQQMMMGIDEKPFVNPENQIVPIERYGVKVMSLGFLMDVDQPVIWRGPMVMKAVEQFLQDVAWGRARLPARRPAARHRRRAADPDAEDPSFRRRHRDDAPGRVA